jgi:hypothetical protein
LHVLRQSFPLPAGQTAAEAGLGGDRAVVETQEFVHEQQAEELRVLPLIGRGTLRLCVELLRRLPQVAFEEVQARLELGFGKIEPRIHPRSARIDVEIGDARQRSRLLPAEVAMAGRHEAQLAAELSQGRPRQAFDEGLAVIPLSAFTHDQQMTRCPESVFEGFTPEDFDGVGLDRVPPRKVPTSNVRRGKSNEG